MLTPEQNRTLAELPHLHPMQRRADGDLVVRGAGASYTLDREGNLRWAKTGKVARPRSRQTPA